MRLPAEKRTNPNFKMERMKIKKNEAEKSTDDHATVSKENGLKTSSHIENDENETPSMQSMSLSKHVTGHGRAIGLAAFVLILCFIAIKYIRDE